MGLFRDHQNKRVCDVVFPGSHDAAMTSGGASVKTQNVNIREQANFGCRWFDIRIMYAKKSEVIEPVAFHAPGGKRLGPQTKHRGPDEYQTIRFGGTGLSLENICLQAKEFVEENKSEFLFIRFDKCEGGYLRIANRVYELLGETAKLNYTGKNLNLAPISSLGGKVIPLFPDKEKPLLASLENINFWKNLYAEGGGSYEPDYRGLQYFGKNSDASDPKKSIAIQQNERLPGALREVQTNGMAIETLGMMYWTATSRSPRNNIVKRDNKLWQNGGDAKLGAIWHDCVKQSMEIKSELVHHPHDLLGGLGQACIKSFMPNIITIDQVDLVRCQTIWDLNQRSPHEIQKAFIEAQNLGKLVSADI